MKVQLNDVTASGSFDPEAVFLRNFYISIFKELYNENRYMR